MILWVDNAVRDQLGGYSVGFTEGHWYDYNHLAAQLELDDPRWSHLMYLAVGAGYQLDPSLREVFSPQGRWLKLPYMVAAVFQEGVSRSFKIFWGLA